MHDFALRLKDIVAVNKFIKVMRTIDCDMVLQSEDRHYSVDAKSIMGVLSLNLGGQLRLMAYTNKKEILDQIKWGLETL